VVDKIGTELRDAVVDIKSSTLWDPRLIFHHPFDARSIALLKKLTLMFLNSSWATKMTDA
jgi:hypothetical protein